MPQTDEEEPEDEGLRRLLNTPARPHKQIGLTPMKAKRAKNAHKKSARPKLRSRS